MLSITPEGAKPKDQFTSEPYRAPNGFTPISDALKNWPGLNWTDRFIYSRIERYAKQGEAYPSHQTLAREAGIKRERALRICHKLKEAGLLKVTRRWKEDTKRFDVNIYKVLKPWRGYVPEKPEPCDLKVTDKIVSSSAGSKNQQQQQRQVAT